MLIQEATPGSSTDQQQPDLLKQRGAKEQMVKVVSTDSGYEGKVSSTNDSPPVALDTNSAPEEVMFIAQWRESKPLFAFP